MDIVISWHAHEETCVLGVAEAGAWVIYSRKADTSGK